MEGRASGRSGPSTTVRRDARDGGRGAGPRRRRRSSRRPSGASPQVVLERPQLVGFGTVADLAEAARAGAATVVRLAAKLGFDGFSALQASIQRDLVAPAATGRRAHPRARRRPADHPPPRRPSCPTSRHARRRRPGDARRRRRRCSPTSTARCSCSPATPSAASPLQFATDLGALRAGVAIDQRQRRHRAPPARPRPTPAPTLVVDRPAALRALGARRLRAGPRAPGTRSSP